MRIGPGRWNLEQKGAKSRGSKGKGRRSPRRVVDRRRRRRPSVHNFYTTKAEEVMRAQLTKRYRLGGITCYLWKEGGHRLTLNQ